MEAVYKWLWKSAPVARKVLKLLGPSAIAFLALSANFIFQVNFGLPALQARPVLGLVWQIVLWSIYLPFAWCFYYCCTAKPWDPKALFSMDPEEMTSPRMCEKCHDIKPPRAHHCSLCERCILRMDHHCIWLGTCIGEHNYKSFILILVYAMALCAFYVLSSFRIMHLLALPLHGPGPVILWYILSGVGLMTIPFVGFHVYLIMHNRTTLEFFARLSRHPNASDSDMFDHGSWNKNWREVFGQTVSDWLVPTVNSNSKTRYVIKKRPVDL